MLQCKKVIVLSMQNAEHFVDNYLKGQTMTYDELEVKLQKWVDALETQKAIIREHEQKVALCEYHIQHIRQSMEEALQA